MLSRYFKTLPQKFQSLRVPHVEQILSTSLVSQVTILVLTVMRIPISLHFFGIEEYGILLILLTYWQIMVMFGESARKAWRLEVSWLGSVPIATLNKSALAGYLSISTVASFIFWSQLGISGFMMSNIVALVGLTHLKYSPYAGILELNGFYGKVNWHLLSSNLLCFLPWYFSCRFENNYLYLITACSAYPLSSYLCRKSCRRNLKKTKLNVPQKQHIDLRFGHFLALSFVSKSSYLIDPFMIQGQLGAAQVVAHSFYQKFLTLYSFTASALSPLFMVESARGHATNLSRYAEKYLSLITILTTLPLFVFYKEIFYFLSSGEISSSVYLVLLVLLQGIIGSTVTRVIQSANSNNQLTFRIKIGALGTIISALATFFLLPVFGISISFITSILYSLAMYFCLRKKN